MLDDLPPPWNHQGRFTPQIVCTIFILPEIAREDLPLKSSVQFTPPETAFISTFLAPKSDIN